MIRRRSLRHRRMVPQSRSTHHSFPQTPRRRRILRALRRPMVRRTTARPTATTMRRSRTTKLTPLTTATTAILATRIPQARGAGVVDRVARSSRRSAKDLVARSVDRLYVVVSERVGRTICAPTRRRLRRHPSRSRARLPRHRPLCDASGYRGGRWRVPSAASRLRSSTSAAFSVSGRVRRSAATSRVSLAHPRMDRAHPDSLHSSRRSASQMNAAILRATIRTRRPRTTARPPTRPVTVTAGSATVALAPAAGSVDGVVVGGRCRSRLRLARWHGTWRICAGLRRASRRLRRHSALYGDNDGGDATGAVCSRSRLHDRTVRRGSGA